MVLAAISPLDMTEVEMNAVISISSPPTFAWSRLLVLGSRARTPTTTTSPKLTLDLDDNAFGGLALIIFYFIFILKLHLNCWAEFCINEYFRVRPSVSWPTFQPARVAISPKRKIKDKNM